MVYTELLFIGYLSGSVVNIFNKTRYLVFLSSLVLYLFSFVGFSAQFDHAFSEPIESHLKESNFGPYKNLVEKNIFDKPLSPDRAVGLSFRKSTSSAGEYSAGIYDFVVSDANKLVPNSLYFDNFPWLKNKSDAKALLQITFLQPCEKCTITLPAMDTVIRGDVAHSNIYINKNATNKYYFLDKQTGPSNIKARGRVYAAKPSDFRIPKDSPTQKIGNLYKNNYAKFIAEHSDAAGKIIYKDVHSRPARPHQIDQLIQMSQAMLDGHKYSTIVAATGSGKSYTMQRMAELSGKKVLIITSRENLVSQLMDSFKADFKTLKVASSQQSQISFPNFFPAAMKSHDVFVATLQAFQRDAAYKTPNLLKDVDIIIFDEAHNLLSLERKNMVNYLQSYQEKSFDILFFTATPKRLSPHKKSGLLSVYELSGEVEGRSHVRPFDFHKAIDAKVNAPFQIAYVSNIKIEEELKKDGDDYNINHVAKIISNPKIHEIIFDILSHAQAKKANGEVLPLAGKSTIAFCSNINHAEELARALNNQAGELYKNSDFLEQKKQAYEKLLRSYVMSFKNKDAPPELKPIWQVIQGSAKSKYENWFISEKALLNLADEFLRKYAYVFADPVHAGNKHISISSDEGNARLIRNKFGGSTVLCGADKLTEGYDNPDIEVILLLRPVRKSNIKSLQSFGRGLRVNPLNPNKVAIAIEFIWDKKQLLLSSSDVLGCMYYGVNEPLYISIPFNPNLMSYNISTESQLSGAVHTDNKKRKPSFVDEDLRRPSKKVCLKPTPKSTDNLLIHLQDLILRLQKRAEALFKFTLTNDDAKEAQEEVINTESTQITLEHPEKASNAELDEPEDTIFIKNLFADASSAVSVIKSFFEAKKSRQVKTGKKLERAASSPVEEITNNFNKKPKSILTKKELLEKLIQKMSCALNKSESYITGCQLGDPAGEIRDLLSEVVVLGNTVNAPKNSVISPIETTNLVDEPMNLETTNEPPIIFDNFHGASTSEAEYQIYPIYHPSVTHYKFIKPDYWLKDDIVNNFLKRHIKAGNFGGDEVAFDFQENLSSVHIRKIIDDFSGKPLNSVVKIIFDSSVFELSTIDIIELLSLFPNLKSFSLKFNSQHDAEILIPALAKLPKGCDLYIHYGHLIKFADIIKIQESLSKYALEYIPNAPILKKARKFEVSQAITSEPVQNEMAIETVFSPASESNKNLMKPYNPDYFIYQIGNKVLTYIFSSNKKDIGQAIFSHIRERNFLGNRVRFIFENDLIKSQMIEISRTLKGKPFSDVFEIESRTSCTDFDEFEKFLTLCPNLESLSLICASRKDFENNLSLSSTLSNLRKLRLLLAYETMSTTKVPELISYCAHEISNYPNLQELSIIASGISQPQIQLLSGHYSLPNWIVDYGSEKEMIFRKKEAFSHGFNIINTPLAPESNQTMIMPNVHSENAHLVFNSTNYQHVIDMIYKTNNLPPSLTFLSDLTLEQIHQILRALRPFSFKITEIKNYASVPLDFYHFLGSCPNLVRLIMQGPKGPEGFYGQLDFLQNYLIRGHTKLRYVLLFDTVVLDRTGQFFSYP